MILAALIASFTLTNTNIAQAPFRALSFEEACKEAAAKDKLVFVDFYTDWCGPCKQMDRETWTDPAVIEWLEQHTVAIKVDADREEGLKRQYRVRGYPSLMFMDGEGYEKGRMLGFRTATEFLREGRGVQANIQAVQRLRGEVQSAPLNPNLKRLLANKLFEQSDHEQALDLYLWCFDFRGTETIDPLNGQELVDVLAKAKLIAKSLGRAREEVDLRWQIERLTVLGDKPTARNLEKLLAIAEAFGFDEALLQVYDELIDARRTGSDTGRANVPGVESLIPTSSEFDPAPLLFDQVLQELMRVRRFDAVLEGFGDPKSWMEREVAELEKVLGHLRRAAVEEAGTTQTSLAETIEEELRPMRRKTGLLYQALLATAGQGEAASRLGQRLIEVDPTAESWKTLMRNARKAGRKDLQEALHAEAMASLPVDERSKLPAQRD